MLQRPHCPQRPQLLVALSVSPAKWHPITLFFPVKPGNSAAGVSKSFAMIILLLCFRLQE